MSKEDSLNKSEIVIYTALDGTVQTEVRLFEDTLWLAEQQIASVFGRDRTVIGKHIKTIFRTGELEEKSNVQKMHIANSDKPVAFYSLDMILSIGYKVNSKKGTQFRIWANRILKEHLITGYTLNEKRLKEKNDEFQALKSAIELIERSVSEKTESLDEAKNVIKVLADFARGLTLLDDYDHESLDTKGKTEITAVHIEANEFFSIISQMKDHFSSEFFGKAKDESFFSSVRQIYQSFDGKELYPAIEEKAAMLLYLVVKNHSFVDGNKRIAAAAFLHFLHRNNLLYRSDGIPIINSDALAALTLLIAESKPEEKDTMVKIIISILNRGQL